MKLSRGCDMSSISKKRVLPVDKIDDHLGSYAPNTKTKPFYEVELPESEAPSGFLARGNYSAVSKFIDDDKTNHLTLNWGVKKLSKNNKFLECTM